MILIITEKELIQKEVRELVWNSAFIILQKDSGEEWIHKSRSQIISPDIKLSRRAFSAMLKENRNWYK